MWKKDKDTHYNIQATKGYIKKVLSTSYHSITTKK